jgi:hypothetical protein
MANPTESMSAYQKNVLAWIVIMTLGLAVALASLYVSTWFLVAFAAIIYGPQFLLKRIACPKCGTPVTYQGSIAGFPIHGGFIRRQCQSCGWDLRRRLQASDAV